MRLADVQSGKEMRFHHKDVEGPWAFSGVGAE